MPIQLNSELKWPIEKPKDSKSKDKKKGRKEKSSLSKLTAEFLYKMKLRRNQNTYLCDPELFEKELDFLLTNIRDMITVIWHTNSSTSHTEEIKIDQNKKQAVQDKLAAMDDNQLITLARATVARFNRIMLEENFRPDATPYCKLLSRIESSFTSKSRCQKSQAWIAFEEFLNKIS